jgi:hypothetical protein
MSDFLLILIAVIVLFSVFRRYIFFAIMGALTKKLFEQAHRQQQQYAPPGSNRQPGSVKVDAPAPKKGRNTDSGEYVDFEEVKD